MNELIRRSCPMSDISRFAHLIFGIMLVCVLNLTVVSLSAYADEGVREGLKCSSAESIKVSIWMQSAEETIGYPYIVCPADRRSSELKRIRIATNTFYENWQSFHADEVKRNETIFKIILNRFRNLPALNRSKELETALTWIEQLKARGLTSYSIAVSPDGRYAVFAITGRKPSMLLIEVPTLTTHHLWDDFIALWLDMPISWSTDSRYVAFAIPPPGHQKVYIYDVEKMTSEEIRMNENPWVEAFAWSSDSRNLALFEWRNRRMDKNPFALLLAYAGHPSFRNDAYLSVYSLKNGECSSVLLSKGISEASMKLQIEWK